MTMLAGSATRVINCDIGDDLCGQLHRRICESVRDDLEANFLYLESDEDRMLLVSLDSGGIFPPGFVPRLREAVAAATGLPPRNVIVASSHTHTGPDLLGLLYDTPVNLAYGEKLCGWLAEGAGEAVTGARPARVGCAQGTAHVGYNRRHCWADGTHTMYGDAARLDFCGLEGPDDPRHAVLFALDETDRYIAVLHNNACHATCVESALYASADFPGEARRQIRSALGAGLPVLYLQGASGDLSPWDQLLPSRYDGEQRLREVGMALAAETLHLLKATGVMETPVIRHAFADLELGVRLPDEKALARAREIVALGEEKTSRWDYILARGGVLRLQEAFGANPVDIVPVHAVRIGDFAIVTNPCEYYCQFGIDTRRRSPAAVTAVSQLTDGFNGYCPTIPAIMGGGYSGETIYWCRLEPYAGYKIVETATTLLNRLWREDPVSAAGQAHPGK